MNRRSSSCTTRRLVSGAVGAALLCLLPSCLTPGAGDYPSESGRQGADAEAPAEQLPAAEDALIPNAPSPPIEPAAADQVEPLLRSTTVPWSPFLRPPAPPVRFLARFPTGNEPKSVLFSHDGSVLYVPLLADSGVDRIDLRTGEQQRIQPDGYGGLLGFVEATVGHEATHVYVSQMTAGMIHRLQGSVFVDTIPAHGRWPKVVAVHPTSPLLAVSNWLDDTVTVVDSESGALVSRLSTDGTTPRGVAFSADGALLYVSYFGNGMLACFDTARWAQRWIVSLGGALRHIVLARDGTRAYVSDMLRRQVLELGLKEGGAVVEARFATGPNPNTVVLTPDERYLLVSSRGPNNPEGYRLPSPEGGAIRIFDAATRQLITTVPGGLQPTGLAVSPDGKMLAFSNFQDDTVELYDLSNLP